MHVYEQNLLCVCHVLCFANHNSNFITFLSICPVVVILCVIIIKFGYIHNCQN